MKKILLLFIIISIVTLSAPKPSNNQNINKTVAELQIQIKELEQKINKQNEEYLKLKKEVEERIGLTYNIDQIYSTSKSHYEDSIKKVEELYSKSFENYDKTLIIFLGFLGILMTIVGALFAGLKIYDSKKYKEMKEEVFDDMKEKKIEIEGNIEKRFNTTLECVDRIVNTKITNIEKLEEQMKKMKLIIESNDKLIDDKFEFSNKEFDEKMKKFEVRNIEIIVELNKLNGEIKNEVSLYKKDILCEVTDLKSQFEEIQKRQKQNSEITEEKDINFDENTKIDKLIIDAKELYKKQDYIGVVTTLEGSYLKNDYNINYWLGLANYKLLKYAEAIYYFELSKKLVQTKSDNYYSTYWLGKAYYESKNYEKAIEVFESSKELASTESNKYYSTYWLGMSYYCNKNYEKAIEVFELSKELALTESNKYYSTYWLGMSYYYNKNYEKAIEVFKSSKELALTESNKYYSTYWLGKAYYESKNCEKAIEVFELSKELASTELNKYYSIYWLGLAYYESKNYEKAIEVLELSKKLVQTKSDNYYSTYWLGKAYYESKNYDNAIIYFKEVSDLENSNKYFASYYLTECYYEKNIKEKAIESINKALEIRPDNDNALKLKEKIEKMPDNSDNKTEE